MSMFFSRAVAFVLLAFFGTAETFAVDFRVSDFGAVGDGKTLTTAALQRALDACAGTGGRVVVPPGKYLTGTLWLGDATELHLEKGAVLLGSPDLSDYNAPDAYAQNFGSKGEGWSACHLLVALEKRNVALTGEGAIDGNARAFMADYPVWYGGDRGWRDGVIHPRDRANAVRPGPELAFVECRGVRIEGVTLRDMACWTCLLHGCDDVTIRGVTVRTDRRYANTDAFDIDSCRNVTVTGCDIETGDDAFAVRGAVLRLKNRNRACENILISNNVCRVSANGVRVGVGGGEVRNVRVTDLSIEGAHDGIIVQSSFSPKESLTVRDLVFERIAIRGAGTGIRVTGGTPGSTSVLERVTFRDVTIVGTPHPISVTGCGKTRPRSIRFENVRLKDVRFPHVVRDADEVSFVSCDGERREALPRASYDRIAFPEAEAAPAPAGDFGALRAWLDCKKPADEAAAHRRVDEFLLGYYGTARFHIRQYLNELYAHETNRLKRFSDVGSDDPFLAPRLPRDFCARAALLWKKALDAATIVDAAEPAFARHVKASAPALTGSSATFALVSDGRPVVEIVCPADRQVAADVAFFTNAVARCTGARLPVVSSRTPGGRAIVFELVPEKLMTADDWQVSFPDAATLKIRGTAAWSCRWALNEILEKDAGVVFVIPGPYGTHYPQSTTLSVPQETRSGTSSYKVNRELWREDPQYARSLGAKKQPYRYGSFKGHNLWLIFHPSIYAKEPWLGKIMPLRNGRRVVPKCAFSGWQPCLSHPESVPEAVRRVLEHLEKHPNDKAVPLAMNDLEGWCECNGCRAMNGGFETHSDYLPQYVTHSPSYWKWVNAVAAELVKVRPNLLIGTIAYCGTLDPPPFKIHPNVAVSLAIDMVQTRDPEVKAKKEKLIAAWCEKASIVGLGGYDYGSIKYMVPRLYTRLMEGYLCGNKRRHPELNSVFAEGAGERFSGEGPKRYLHFKMMFDPAFDLDREETRWYDACCGKAAAPFLRAYYEKAEAFWMGDAVTKTGWYKSVKGDYFNFDNYDYVTALKPSDLDEATALMEKAVAAAQSGDADQRARAARLELFHRYFVSRIRSFAYDCAVPNDAASAAAFLERLPTLCREARKSFAAADEILSPDGRALENVNAEYPNMRDDFRKRAYEEVNPLVKTRLVAASDYLVDPTVRKALDWALGSEDVLPKVREFVERLGKIGTLPNLAVAGFVEKRKQERRYRVKGIRTGSNLGVRIRVRNKGRKNKSLWLYFAPILPANGALNGHKSRNASLPSGAVREFVFFGNVPDNAVWDGVTEGAVGVYDHGGAFNDDDLEVEEVYACEF